MSGSKDNSDRVGAAGVPAAHGGDGVDSNTEHSTPASGRSASNVGASKAVTWNHRQVTSRSAISVAVLDDHEHLAIGNATYFKGAGLDAQAYFTATSLIDALAMGRAHNAFVLDWILGDGETSEPVIKYIRTQSKTAPIILLTGEMHRDGAAREEDRVIERYSLFYLEKPARSRTLVDTIVDQIESRQQLSDGASTPRDI